MAFKIELEKYENYRRLFRAKSAKTHVSPSLQELILRTNEYINSDHCQEWQVSVIIWFLTRDGLEFCRSDLNYFGLSRRHGWVRGSS